MRPELKPKEDYDSLKLSPTDIVRFIKMRGNGVGLQGNANQH